MKLNRMESLGGLAGVENDPPAIYPLSHAVSLEKAGDRIVDTKTGDEYFEKTSDAQTEYFVMLLSKGILHVSDLIEKDGKYYSRKMPLEQLAPAEAEEKDVELFLLKYLFGDHDHREGANYRSNDSGQFAHYDYGEAFSTVVPDRNRLLKAVGNFYLKRGAIRAMKDRAKGTTESSTKENFARILKEKLDLFRQALNNDSFFRAVLEKSGLSLNGKLSFLKGDSEEDRAVRLREYLLDRISLLEKITL